LTLEQVAAIRRAAATWRTAPGLPGPKSDGQVRDIIEVLLGTAMRPGEVLALRAVRHYRRPTRDGGAGPGNRGATQGRRNGAQDHPKTDPSTRRIPIPAFAAEVLRRRLAMLGPGRSTSDHLRQPVGRSAESLQRASHVRDFLKLAGLGDSGISLRWYRRTGATVVARALSFERYSPLPKRA
jgi:integrase